MPSGWREVGHSAHFAAPNTTGTCQQFTYADNSEYNDWTDWKKFIRLLGDVNGDGKDDIVGFGKLFIQVAAAR